MMQRPRVLLSISLPVLLGLVATSRNAHAQAWVGEQRSLDLSLDYNLGKSDRVIGDGDLEFPDSGITTHQLTIGAEYVPIEKLAVNLSLPFVALKYTGNPTAYPHPGGGRYDDGDLHSTVTDLRVGTRYQLLAEPVAISPHIGFSIPLADYETIGNAVAGRHLKAAHLGASVGKVFMEALYVHLTYEFSLVEKYDRTADTKKYSQNNSAVSFAIGYQLLEGKLDLNLSTNLRTTHGGVSFNDFGTFTMDETLYHDAILKEEIVLVGAGIGYQLSETLSAAIAGRLFVAGNNTQNANVLGLSVSWSPVL